MKTLDENVISMLKEGECVSQRNAEHWLNVNRKFLIEGLLDNVENLVEQFGIENVESHETV